MKIIYLSRKTVKHHFFFKKRASSLLKMAECSLCLKTDEWDSHFPHWGLHHVCRKCYQFSHDWNKWDEDDLANSAWKGNAKAIATAFYLINRRRRQNRARRDAKHRRQIMNEKRVTRGHQPILPNLRRNRMKVLGYLV